jgi:hypothetical protein
VRGVSWPPKPGEALPRAAECWYEQVKLDDWVLAERGHGPGWSRVFHLEPEDGERFWEAISAAVAGAPIATVRDEDEGAAPGLATAYVTL